MLDNLESLSDHKYIIMSIKKAVCVKKEKRQNYLRWKRQEMNEDLFITTITADVWTDDRQFETAEIFANNIGKILRENS